jgi:hypothetical protein
MGDQAAQGDDFGTEGAVALDEDNREQQAWRHGGLAGSWDSDFTAKDTGKRIVVLLSVAEKFTGRWRQRTMRSTSSASRFPWCCIRIQGRRRCEPARDYLLDRGRRGMLGAVALGRRHTAAAARGGRRRPDHG